MNLKSIAIALAMAGLLSACGSFPKNPPLSNYDPDQGYRFGQLDRGNNSDELFVIVTFSGGGTRAAALSYGVLEALRDTKINLGSGRISLLQEVDVISSISGGSFPAAYYALKREKIFVDFPDKFLYRPIQSDLTKQAFSPGNWFKLAGSSYGRSDLAAEYYDRAVFGGATYADVVKQRLRPFVILNATDMSTGQQFPFVQDQFDLLCSDLSGLPIARAVAASSAFPGLLTPLTFQNYAGSCNYQQPPWVSLALEDHKSRINTGRTARAENRVSYSQTGSSRRDYIHLIDGGVSDNIGLRGPLTALSTTNFSWSVVRKLNNREIDKILVIVVNAATDPDTHRDDSSKVPGLVDTVTSAATVPMENYSFDSIKALKAAIRENTVNAQLIRDCKSLAAEKGDQCVLDISGPHKVDLFPVEVAFEYIESDTDRNWFKNLPTNFELPKDTVDKLRDIGRKLLSQDEAFQKFLSSVNGCMPVDGDTC
jgi:predicted acylesterase/phospholipase RssA